MAYLTEENLESMGFKKLGHNIKISDRASIYNADQIEIGDNSRIDDFCVISGLVKIGSYCHITPMCLVAGGVPGLEMEDFCTLAYGVKLFTQSDDYSGESMVNSLIPQKFKKEIFKSVKLERHTIVGSGSIILPGVQIGIGCSIGAMSLVKQSTDPWGIYAGSPAKRIKERSRNLLNFEKFFLEGVNK